MPPLLAAALALWGPACQAHLLTVCVSNNPVPPLTYPNREGPAQLLVRQAVENLGGQISFITAPWLRCRLGVKTGTYTAALPMVTSPEFLTDFAFPLKGGGTADSSRAVGTLTISVVRRVGSPVQWDGSSFQQLATPVMVLPGQMLGRDKLKALGVAEDVDSPQADSLLRKLVMERREVAVLPTGIAQSALATEEFRDKLELLAQPLAMEPAYLSFNREFQRGNLRHVQAIWTELARLRAAPTSAPAKPAPVR